MTNAKNHKKKRAAVERLSKSWGLDYGCLPRAMAVSSVDFPRNLTVASVDAVAYGIAYCDALSRMVPAISLVARDGAELAKAFETFNAWSKATDPDSVELTFSFPKAGGYVLGISAEPSRLIERCLGFNRVLQPVMIAPTWFKTLDSVSPHLLQFRKYCLQTIAPFFLDGVVHVEPTSALNRPSPPALRPISGLNALLKFEATFIDEETANPVSKGWFAMKSAKKKSPATTVQGPPKPTPVEIARRRVAALTRHFPVTLERMRVSEPFRDLSIRFRAEGARDWQIEQGFCNVALRHELEIEPRYVSLGGPEMLDEVYRYLSQRIEIADGKSAPVVGEEELRAQIITDGLALLDFLKEKQPVDNLADTQSALQSVYVLEAESALSDLKMRGASTK